MLYIYTFIYLIMYICIYIHMYIYLLLSHFVNAFLFYINLKHILFSANISQPFR